VLRPDSLRITPSVSRNWKIEDTLGEVDLWIRAHDRENNTWLWSAADEHRSRFERICGMA
jgi:hypothetical protein